VLPNDNFCWPLAIAIGIRYSIVFVVVVPVTCRVKGYARFVEEYVTGRRKLFRPDKVYIFLDSVSGSKTAKSCAFYGTPTSLVMGI